MAQQGKINFPDLSRYIWKADNFNTMQTYLDAFMSDSMSVRNSPGIISGCSLSLVSGLTIHISPGLVLFPNGVLVSVPAQQVTLSAANVTNPRIDRIELAYSLVNNNTVLNIDNQTKTFDKLHNAVSSASVGTAGVSPSAPVKSVNSISLGCVTVSAGATSLVIGNLDQTIDSCRDASSIYVGLSGEMIRYNESLSIFQFSKDGINWLSVSIDSLMPQKFTIANNQTTALAINGLFLDNTKYIGLIITAQINISTSSNEYAEHGEIKVIYKPISNTFSLSFSSSFDDAGVVFSVDSLGQIKYTSGNVPGSSYSGVMRILNVKMIAI